MKTRKSAALNIATSEPKAEQPSNLVAMTEGQQKERINPVIFNSISPQIPTVTYTIVNPNKTNKQLCQRIITESYLLNKKNKK